MKRVLMICGLLFSVITFAEAQQGGGRGMGNPEERAKRNTEMLAEKLKLSDDQKAKVEAIYLEQAGKMKKLRDSVGDNREGMRAVMMKSTAEGEARIDSLLTDDQKKAFTAWKEERKEQMKKRAEERKAGGQRPSNR